MKKIEPGLPSGFKDYLPEDTIPRNKMLSTIRATFERFGFVPLDTPGVEREEILTGGDPDFKKQLFRVGLQEGEEKLALRFDLTIPLARVISTHPELGRPFKRYQVGPVWRGERPQAGRFREFIQFDADIVGSDHMLADAEIIALMYRTMTALGFLNFIIKVNTRKILNALPDCAGFSAEHLNDALRSIDKMDKIGWSGVKDELEKLGLDGKQLASLKDFLDIKDNDQRDTINKIKELMKDSIVGMEGAAELEQIAIYLKDFGVPDETWTIDPSLARGLGYYTGPVFEAVLTDAPEIGSVSAGGRYDNLVERFSSQSVPATGVSIGVDRLFAAMEKLNLVERTKSTAQALVLNFAPSAESECIRTLSAIREKGVSSEVYLGKEKTLKGQLVYAAKQDIRVVVIIGEDELKRGVAQIKELETREQIESPLKDVPTAVANFLTTPK